MGERRRRCEVAVEICHGRKFVRSRRQNIFKVRFQKAKSVVSRHDTRANKRQEQERESQEEKL